MTTVETPVKWTERHLLDLLHARYSRGSQATGRRYVCAEHVRDKLGFGVTRTADFLAQDLWAGIPAGTKADLHGHEVKVSRSDWLRELKDPHKAEAFRPYCHRWWLVVPDAAIVKPGELPDGWGLLALRGGALAVKVQAPRQEPEPMSRLMWASIMRATAKTATRIGWADEFGVTR